MRRLKLAILDLYDGEPNQGMRAITEIVKRFEGQVDFKIFDVRKKMEIPDLSFDIFISSGGPGSPLDGDGKWNALFYKWMDEVWLYNESKADPKKFVFFICHSFQMACDHYDLARVIERKSRSFGTTPIHKTELGKSERFFEGLDDPFCGADFRLWQVIQPDEEEFERRGAKILALEKIRPHIPLERAIMAVRFSKEIFGVQFHPEADPEGMLFHFNKPDLKEKIVAEHGVEKFEQMMNDLKDESKIPATYDKILPSFINEAIQELTLPENSTLV